MWEHSTETEAVAAGDVCVGLAAALEASCYFCQPGSTILMSSYLLSTQRFLWCFLEVFQNWGLLNLKRPEIECWVFQARGNSVEVSGHQNTWRLMAQPGGVSPGTSFMVAITEVILSVCHFLRAEVPFPEVKWGGAKPLRAVLRGSLPEEEVRAGGRRQRAGLPVWGGEEEGASRREGLTAACLTVRWTSR